jgi:hypothetical protein
VNPLLLGGGVLALLALAASSGATPVASAYAPAQPPPEPLPQPTPIPIALTPVAPANPIDAASGDYTATLSFGDSPTTTSSTFTIAPSGSAPLHDDIAWWVNHYLGTSYASGAYLSPAVLDHAVHVALSTEPNLYWLLEFSTILTGYGQVALGQQVEDAVNAAEVAQVAQGTLKWAGTQNVSPTTILTAVNAALASTPASMDDITDMHDFGLALVQYESSNTSSGPFAPQGLSLINQAQLDTLHLAPPAPTPPPPSKTPIAKTPGPKTAPATPAPSTPTFHGLTIKG